VFGPIFFADQSKFPYVAIIEITPKDSFETYKYNSEAPFTPMSGKILAIYADVANFYRQIAIPISASNVSFTSGGNLIPIQLTKMDVVRVDSQSKYKTDSLKGLKNVEYRALVNFNPNILETYRDEISGMSVDTGDKVFSVLKNWRKRNEMMQSWQPTDPAIDFINKVKTAFNLDPVVVPFALIKKSVDDPSSKVAFETISSQMRMTRLPNNPQLETVSKKSRKIEELSEEEVEKTSSPHSDNNE
jgi:hypothetical protein